jgi:hypothetical protein
LAYLYLARFYAMPDGQGRDDDSSTALGFFGVLEGLAPDRVPPDIRRLLHSASREPADELDRLTAEGAAAFGEHERTGRPELLDEAVAAFREVMAAAGPDHPNAVVFLSNLGGTLYARFELAGDPADLDAAIDTGRRAVESAPHGHPHLGAFLSNLGGSLCARFELAGDPADLDAAIDAGRRAVESAPPGHPDQATYMSTLSSSLFRRFELAGDPADLDAAIDAGRQAVHANPPGSLGRGMYLSNLGGLLRARFELAGDSADLDAAIDVGQQAVQDTPQGHPQLVGDLSNLGASLTVRFQTTGAEADLDAAIKCGRQAISACPADHPGLAALLSNLGNILLVRFENKGIPADLDDAVDAGKQAVAATAPGHPGRAGFLSNLGNFLHVRFEVAGDTADLDAAIEAGRQAVGTIPPAHPALPTVASNLGAFLRTRYEQTGEPADLDAAIEAGRQAVAATQPGHYDLPGHLSNLGASLRDRFKLAGDPADLDAAIEAGQQAVAATPPDNPSRAGFLSNLGTSLIARFGRTADLADLDAAIDAGRQAVASTPHGHPALAGHLLNLGTSLVALFRRTEDDTDFDAVIDCWRQAAQVTTAPPHVRLTAARNWAGAAAISGRAREATEGYTMALAMLPIVAWHGLDRMTRRQQLTQWAGLASDAAASAIEAGRPELAVELLEQGRSVLWSQALNLRSDLTRLAAEHPELAQRLDSIRTALNAPLPDLAHPSPEQAQESPSVTGGARHQIDPVDLRKRKAREWDDALAEARTLPGFERFLAPTPYAELVTAAAAGPVVVVNVSQFRCHALIIAAGGAPPEVIDLPALSLEGTMGYAGQMQQALAGATDSARLPAQREQDRHAILDVLDWLWDAIAQPVLTALAHPEATGAPEARPRVWWCPTGPLAILPLHAAGHHPRDRTLASTGGASSVLDSVISSYTPTLAALTRASKSADPPPVRQLTVGMPVTPGLPPLPGVPLEMQALARHFPAGKANHQFIGPQATRAVIKAAIADHNWLHFACHASQQQADPDRSGFALHDGTLTITDLAAQPVQQRGLAFLSACQTAAGSVRHPDEAIHLAAAMQFLGYQHVIATMWVIRDAPASFVADGFYAELARRSSSGPPGHAAEALHHTIHALRRKDPTDPLRWAGYVHIGR